ncbi:MAG: hypothetical protein ACE10F_11915 [Candidatus Methylomirabilales bacterium]
MGQAFIIMQIGNEELDRVCKKAMVPALKACDLDPKRVDKHNEGGLLKSEIISFIEGSEIIVADVTNERPNCYLEIGYAMGVDKFRNLILMARDDHNQGSPKHRPGGPKVHFDLSGYDVLYWDPDDVDGFRVELEKRVRRRQAVLAQASPTAVSPWDEEWLEEHRGAATAGLKKMGLPGFMEIRFALSDHQPNKTQKELLRAAEQAQVPKGGWPIGIVFTGSYPKVRADGIVAEIICPSDSYDYWTIRRNGDFYLFKSLNEDRERPGRIITDVRILRITETLLYCIRLYTELGVPGTAMVNIGIRHGGLRDRILAVGGRGYPSVDLKASEDELTSEIPVRLTTIEANLVNLVKDVAAPLFMLFEYFEVPDSVYSHTVDGFVKRTTV